MEHPALEITSPMVARVITALCPTLSELSYDKDLHGNFIVVDFPERGDWAIVKAEQILTTWDHIEPGMKIKLVRLVK